MKKIFLSLTFVLFCGHIFAQPLCIPGVQERKSVPGTVEVEKFATVTYDNPSLEFVADYLNKAWENTNSTSLQKKGAANAISLSLKPDKKLGDEGYRLNISAKGITIQANSKRGALWGVQTLLQMKQTSYINTGGVYKRLLPYVTITDKPDYPIRGMMLDCGRKFFPMSYLYSLVNVMSYYKMNCLQIHLNDNGFHDIFHGKWDETYAAFRMESDYFPGLTAIDGSYSKKEMRDFIRYAEKMGVEIIPEIDAPAHCLCFTQYRPSLASKDYDPAHLDLRNPEVVPFLDSLYAEYLGGPDPVFCCPRFHIGTDEYSNKDKEVVELFRKLIVHLCDKVKGYGKQPIFWGSLTHANGETPVPSDGVWISLWHNRYAQPVDMRKQGFHMISINDHHVYIVPAAGYYYDYLNSKWLYQHWVPELMDKELFARQDPYVEGGMFAVWNDVIKNGISVGDVHDRSLPAIQVIAEKCWHGLADTTDVAWEKWQSFSRMLDDGPLTDEIGRKSMVNHIELKPKTTIFKPEGSLFPIHQIGYPYMVEFTIDWADEKPGTVLCTSERSTFYLADPVKGMLGFSRDGYLFNFKYKGKAGKKETIQLKGDNKGITLFADGKEVERLDPDVLYKHDGKGSYKIMRTLVFPLQETGDFRSKITNFSAWR